jgi:hypothetical protein
LNAQLAELTQSLNQATVIPSGVSRIHVFSLGQQEPPTGIPSNLMDGSARTNSLTEALARMAGERMAIALNTAPSSALTMDGATRFGSPNVASTSGQGGVDSVGKVALVPAQPVPVEVSTSGLPNLTTSLASEPILASPIRFSGTHPDRLQCSGHRVVRCGRALRTAHRSVSTLEPRLGWNGIQPGCAHTVVEPGVGRHFRTQFGRRIVYVPRADRRFIPTLRPSGRSPKSSASRIRASMKWSLQSEMEASHPPIPLNL